MSQARHTGKIVLTIPQPWDRDKAVLLTGGTSGLGRELARHLAGQGFRHLVLASRRGPAAAGVPELVDELAARGTRVDVVACDLADATTVRNLVADLGDLTAVVHAAGVLDDATVENLTDEQLTGVLRPKVDAAWHLHEATKDRDLAGFVVYSSVAGVLGTTGQANYAAANAFLDALCRRRKADGLPAVALSWGLWDHATGMTGGMSDVDHARIRRQGQRPIPLDRGLALFDAAVTSDAAQSVIMLVDQQALRAREDLPTILRGLVPTSRRVATRATTSAGSLAERLPGLPPARRRDVLLDVVRRQVAVVLGFGDPDAVDAGRPFKELGFDSLTAVELRNKLGAALGTKLSATLVFDYPTASALVDHLLGTIGGAADAAPASLKDVLDRLEATLSGPASADERRDALTRLVDLTTRLRGADEPSGPAGPTEDDINSVSVNDLFRLIDDNFSAQD
jgi:NAD(P)-dependent dehydrogenase (short-subunit alcohol dehydrogenase family)/acyl carrier protein